MKSFRCKAIVLSRIDYGESDRIVTLLSEEQGRFSAFARGARKSRRRFAGVLDPFCLIDAELTASRGSLVRLDAASLVTGFCELRADLGRMARASCACELAREFCGEEAPAPEFFRRLLAFLEALSLGDANPDALMRFELDALALAGLRPSLEHCVVCGARAKVVRFDPEQGGGLCPSCAPMKGIRISPEALGVLAALQRGELRLGATSDAERAPAWAQAEARAALTGFVVHHMGHALKSYDFMRELGLEG